MTLEVPGMSVQNRRRKPTWTRSQQEATGLKGAFRYDLNDLHGEMVLLHWGGRRGTKPADKPKALATVDSMDTLMSFGADGGQLLGCSLFDSASAPGSSKPFWDRVLWLDQNKLVQELPPIVPDAVGQDIADIPSVLRRINDDWNSNDVSSSSSNRLSAYTFVNRLRPRLLDPEASRPNAESIDLVIAGCEVSLWLGEQFAADLHLAFPNLRILTISANKLLGQLGQGFPTPQVGHPFNLFDGPRLNNAVCLLISHSGGTFSTLAVSNLLKAYTNHVFCITSEWDTQIAKSCRVASQRASNIAELGSYVFVTFAGCRPAEPCTLSVAATQQLLTHLLMYLVSRPEIRTAPKMCRMSDHPSAHCIPTVFHRTRSLALPLHIPPPPNRSSRSCSRSDVLHKVFPPHGG